MIEMNEKTEKDEKSERTYSNAVKKGAQVLMKGWVHDVRELGGINFILLRDKEGMVQVTAAKDKVPAQVMKNVDGMHQEDVIQVEGKVVENKKAPGGLEVIPSKLDIINKFRIQAAARQQTRNFQPQIAVFSADASDMVGTVKKSCFRFPGGF